MRFQTIAPIKAARIVFSVASPLSMMPLPTVFATAVVTNAPARFASAAIRTAIRGVSARVDTDVATAFAVSWNPFVKSKRAPRPRRRRAGRRSTVLDENRLENVGRVLTGVDRLLELLVDVFPADDLDRVVGRAEEIGDGLAVQPVALVLELAQLVQLAARVLEPVEAPTAAWSLWRSGGSPPPARAPVGGSR